MSCSISSFIQTMSPTHWEVLVQNGDSIDRDGHAQKCVSVVILAAEGLG